MTTLNLPPMDLIGVLKHEQKAILDMRVQKNGALPLTKVLLRWQGQKDKDVS